jgi:DNA-binding NtrC family response regulator
VSVDPKTTTRVVRRADGPVRVMQGWLARVVDGKQAGETKLIDRPVFRVGSHPSNDLVVADETVSKQHLEIAVVDDGYRVTDLGSSNGTMLGGVRVGEVTVRREVELELGERRVRLTPSADEVEVAASKQTSFGKLLGRSVAMRELYGQLEVVAKSDCSVILEGETGVGKELVAESIHAKSARAAGPFVVVDCSAVSGSLLESELFGHVRGAFTGADRDREGLLHAAHGGTVLLDEIGELPLGLQAKLLGALERRAVTPVGAATSKAIDVRVIAATHRDLARLVNERSFRADLFYRLAVVRLRVPALRERVEDIPLLVESFLEQLRAREGDHLPASLSAPALAALAGQPWPGNVRELRNAVERAALGTAAPTSAPQPYSLALEEFVAQFERDYLTDLLEACGGDVRRAATEAGIAVRHLQRLLHRHRHARSA